ncbi:MAG: hypothetical protein JWM10_3238 [Myxococcaceae bacterium]|nr:hypothetical protein [Myxococcaceae bacterium]
MRQSGLRGAIALALFGGTFGLGCADGTSVVGGPERGDASADVSADAPDTTAGDASGDAAIDAAGDAALDATGDASDDATIDATGDATGDASDDAGGDAGSNDGGPNDGGPNDGGVARGRGHTASSLVGAGALLTSPNYRMVSTLGQSSIHQSVLQSPGFRLRGGLVGASGGSR